MLVLFIDFIFIYKLAWSFCFPWTRKLWNHLNIESPVFGAVCVALYSVFSVVCFSSFVFFFPCCIFDKWSHYLIKIRLYKELTNFDIIKRWFPCNGNRSIPKNSHWSKLSPFVCGFSTYSKVTFFEYFLHKLYLLMMTFFQLLNRKNYIRFGNFYLSSTVVIFIKI